MAGWPTWGRHGLESTDANIAGPTSAGLFGAGIYAVARLKWGVPASLCAAYSANALSRLASGVGVEDEENQSVFRGSRLYTQRAMMYAPFLPLAPVIGERGFDVCDYAINKAADRFSE